MMRTDKVLLGNDASCINAEIVDYCSTFSFAILSAEWPCVQLMLSPTGQLFFEKFLFFEITCKYNKCANVSSFSTSTSDCELFSMKKVELCPLKSTSLCCSTVTRR